MWNFLTGFLYRQCAGMLNSYIHSCSHTVSILFGGRPQGLMLAQVLFDTAEKESLLGLGDGFMPWEILGILNLAQSIPLKVSREKPNYWIKVDIELLKNILIFCLCSNMDKIS